jgi:hypothetical protein
MTFADDFNADKAMGMEGTPDYPKIFGITMTPIASGIGCAVLGVIGAGYILMNMAMPVWNDFQKIGGEKLNKESQLQQLQGGSADKIIAELNGQLEQKNKLKSQVTGLFADSKDLDTLLLDINSFIVANQAKLVKFTPEVETKVIDDSSFGEAVDKKLKRQTYNLTLEGTFPQIQGVLRSIERLEPLMTIRDYKSEPVDKQVLALLPTQPDRGQVIPVSQMKIKTEFKLDAIIPLSAEEIEALKPKPIPVPETKPAAAPAKPAEGKK